MAQSKASSIGWMFVPQYYTFVNKDPARLHCFYTKRSTLIHGVEGEDCAPCHGQQEIHEKIMSLQYDDCKVFVSTVDSQSSAESGIIVQVVGELSNKGGAWRKFAQTFFLAEQPNGYFVLNDIFRYIKEESDEEEAPQQQQQDASSSTGAAQSHSQGVPQQMSFEQSSASAPGVSAEHHDLQLSNAHGPSSTAPALTMAPPTEAAQSQTLANLEGLANGNQEQQQVVELHDEIDVGQKEASPTAGALKAEEEAAPQINGSHAEKEQSVEETAAPAVETTPEPIARPSQPSTSEVSHPEASTSNSSQDVSAGAAAAPATAKAPAPSSRPSKPAQQQQSQQPAAAQKQQEPPAPAAPAGPKTWASLAATGSSKWKQQVVSSTQGVSSSGPTSAASTPASSGQQQASEAGPSSSSPSTNNPSGRPETRNIVNYETGHSVIVRNVGTNITYAILRRKVSEKFARGMGADRQYARLAYIDIDRQKQIAHVDFEEEWPLNKFGSGDGNSTIGVEVDGNTMTVEKGKLERRPLAEVNARANSGAAGGPNKGGPNGQRQQGGGQNQGPRTGGQQTGNAGRGQPPRDGQQQQSAAARKATPGRIGGAPRM